MSAVTELMLYMDDRYKILFYHRDTNVFDGYPVSEIQLKTLDENARILEKDENNFRFLSYEEIDHESIMRFYVKECVEDPEIGQFVHKVMFDELIETLDLPKAELEQFAKDVVDRFVNPYVKHFVTSIMLNSFPKYKTRDLPGLKKYLERKGSLPKGLVLGLAGIITYYKGGMRGDTEIVPNDDAAIIGLLKNLWATGDVRKVAEGVLGAEFIWDEDLNRIPGLTDMVADKLELIQDEGMRAAVRSIL